MKRFSKVSIIILNWNGWKDTIECLESLYQITYPNYDVIVIDNGSIDDSVKKIKDWAIGRIPVRSKFFEYNPKGKPIKIIEYTKEEIDIEDKRNIYRKISNIPSNRKLIIIKNDKNYGFAGGNNIGTKFALKFLEPEFILTLNNDTVVTPTFLDELVKVVKSNKCAGIVGSKLSFYDHPNIINSVGTLIFKDGSAIHLGGYEVDLGQYDRVMEIFAPCAASALFRVEMLKEIGLFDEDFFAYLEDVDIAWRCRLACWKCYLAPRSVLYHKHSASSKKYSEFKIYQIERNRILLVIKNYPIDLLLMLPFTSLYRYLILFTAMRESSEVLKYQEKIGMAGILKTLIKAWISAFISTPNFLSKRSYIQNKIKKISNSIIKSWFSTYSTDFKEIVKRR